MLADKDTGIKKFILDRISQIDEEVVEADPEYKQLGERPDELLKLVAAKLSAEDYQALETLLELHCQSLGLEVSASFEYGFKLGGVIMLEVLGGKGELVRGGD